MRDTPSFILHFDLDAFFASVEQKLNPAFLKKPLVVAGKGKRGVVAAASYEARQYGIKSAMPTLMAVQRYPRLVIVEPRFGAYRRVSQKVMGYAQELSPTLEALSLDEAYLDLQGKSLEECIKEARAFRQKVKDELNLAVSVGIASTKILAKLASENAKPDGLRVIRPEHEDAYIKNVMIEKIWGIGPSAQTKLHELGVKTAGDLQGVSLRVLKGLFGQSQGENLYNISRNKDERKVQSTRIRKSISQETTFAQDNANRQELEKILADLSQSMIAKMAAHRVAAKSVSLKVRFRDFQTITRSKSFQNTFEDQETLFLTLKDLFTGVDITGGIRLIGLSVSGLSSQSQLSLFGERVEVSAKSSEEKIELKDVAHWGMKVTHPHFGDGKLLQLSEEGALVKFTDRTRIFSQQAPLKVGPVAE